MFKWATCSYQFYRISYGMKILHIQDTPKISKIFAEILSSKNPNFDSILDGRIGLELAVYKDYGLILLDMCMPKYGGVDFILNLKSRGHSELSKVVIVSGLYMSSVQEEELLKLGIHAVLKKPISLQTFSN